MVGILGCAISGCALLLIASLGTFGTFESVSSRVLKALVDYVPSFLFLGIIVGVESHVTKMPKVFTLLIGFFSWFVGFIGSLSELPKGWLGGLSLSSNLQFVLFGIFVITVLCFVYWGLRSLIRLILPY